jgi:hypothetical protein
MRSIYEELMGNNEIKDGLLTIRLSEESINKIFEDWKKIDTGTRTLIEGRLKSRQKYPDLNDLISFLWDNKNKLKK